MSQSIVYSDIYKSGILQKSLPNILENFPYDDTDITSSTTTKTTSEYTAKNSQSSSSKFSPTIEKQLFVENVISTPYIKKIKAKTSTIRRSYEEISKDIKEIEDFLIASENILKKECNFEKELQIRQKLSKSEKLRKSAENLKFDKENKSPKKQINMKKTPIMQKKYTQKSPNFKINSFKAKKTKQNSPNFYNARLYFRNGKIGCVDTEQNVSNIERTHALIKYILKLEKEKPLVSPESVDKVLKELQKDQEDIRIIESKSEFSNNQTNELLLTNGKILNESEFQATTNSLDEIKNEEEDNIDESVNQQEFVRERVRHLVRRFTARTRKMRTRLEMPPTPSSSNSSTSQPTPPVPQDTNKKTIVESLDLTETVEHSLFKADQRPAQDHFLVCPAYCGGKSQEDVLDPQGKIYISWLCIVSLSFLYNVWVIPLRSAFPFQTKENWSIWFGLDLCADLIYLFDIMFFKHRVMYLFEGFWVKDKSLTRQNYMRKLQFKLDILALMPLDILYLKLGTSAVYLRFPRFLKIQSFWEVFKLLDRVISSPHFVRVAKTLTYMLYMIHLTACAYYAYSAYQGLGSNRWVFSGKGHPYVRCFAFATKTATSIGKNPKPENEGELMFMTAAWLMGVFVFALLISQIRDIISTATRSQSEYRQLMDETLEYMRRSNLPRELQRRVKMWFKFTWDQQRTLDERHILDSLPANLKTDIALAVHIQTLSKVQLFADCEEALLRELVLKLRSVTFLPGDYVCRKGEVGKEMYIVKLGQVHVMGGPNNDTVLATLSEGSVFGEISLLAINGIEGNRRTADVKSKGFSNLFVLSKSDLNEAIVYYPNAQAILKKRARSLMQKNADREREEAKRPVLREADVVIGNPEIKQTAPKLLKTVIQVLPEKSQAARLLKQGSKKIKKNKEKFEKNEINKIDIEKEDDDSIFVENRNRSISPDLLSSIQNELQMQNKFINLTDSEKALIIYSSNPTLQ